MLDTDVFSYLLKGHTLAAKYEPHTKGKVWALSFITVGELLVMPRLNSWGPKKIANLEAAIARTGVIPYDMELCRTWADLRAKTEKAGSPVPDNDLWIAATAIRHSITLVTHNRRNYDDIPGLVFISEAPEIIKRGQIKIDGASAT